jgi:polysaccharide chain length determinant protein (PEP-CTERM system associated)
MVAEYPHYPQYPLSRNMTSRLTEQVVNIRKRKWLVLAVTWAVCLVGWVGAMMVPELYQSQARAIVDEAVAPILVMKGFVVDTTNKQDQAYFQTLLQSRPVLEAVAMRAHLVPVGASVARKNAIAAGLASRINVSAEVKNTNLLQAGNVIDISYTDRDPAAAKNILSVVLRIFAEKAASNARLDMQRAQALVNKQIALYEAELGAADKRRADFRQKYAVYFDVNNNIKQPETLRVAADRADQDYQEAVARANALADEAAKTSQFRRGPLVGGNFTAVNGTTNLATDTHLALAEARRHLAELELVDTDNHPDVILAKQTITQLEAEADGDKSSSAPGTPETYDPLYEELRVKLAEAQADIIVLAARRDKAVGDYNTVKALGANLQKVAAMQADLDRDYDATSKQYDSLVKIRDAADFSAAASDQTARAQFRVIDPPQLPVAAQFPDHLTLFSIVLVVGIVAGVLTPMIMSQVTPTFASASQLRDLGLPVIGAITNVETIRRAPALRYDGQRQVIVYGYNSQQAFVAGSIALLVLYMVIVLSMTGLSKGMW